jgi:hypothetical protein
MILAGVPLGAQSLQFDFAPGKPAPRFQKVLPGAAYSEETGYSFEDAASRVPASVSRA